MNSAIDLRPYLELLERFADGQMTPDEQEQFEERLEQDEELRQAHAAYEQITADLRWVAGHETLRLRLEMLDRRLDQRETAISRMQHQQRHTQNRWVAIVVGVLVLAMAFWIFTRRPSPIPAVTWEQYYQPDPGLSPSETDGNLRPLLAESMSQYREGQYAAALRSLRRVPTNNLGQDTLLYYTGIFLLRDGDAAGARTFLRRVSQQPKVSLARKALYHLGMAHWQANQLSEANAVLKQVAADADNPYQQAARKVLKAGVLDQ
ncbi:tetratricopeptide repeat protein [Hymenobacter sp. GOD-10R]|uniref:tetratricopeptide repeat protein n=1 Tax=Hymenobacter sp. GOD-10R TaxID=3093922 RepID=UPI002D768962|nr:tetratricopeptide repeat protein [Hymenobacter sp. GOD-10R]WRQ28667.1 tetratricopeptide repeat protein [Hymenobacter sp. GOD-10R]